MLGKACALGKRPPGTIHRAMAMCFTSRVNTRVSPARCRASPRVPGRGARSWRLRLAARVSLVRAGPALATRQMLFDFIVEELTKREPEDMRRIRPLRVALQNQRDDLLAFARVLDAKLADIAQAHVIPEPLVREACVLHRLPSTSSAYWQGWNRLRAKMGAKFHALIDAVSRTMAQTPRSSSLVENLNSRLRTYFTLRRHLGGSYLSLLQFFLNHRRFMRSRRAERNGKSPRELMTGKGLPHWLTLLGLGPLQPQRA